MDDKDLQNRLDAYLNRFSTFVASPRTIRIPAKRGIALELLAAAALAAVVVAVLAVPIVVGRLQSRSTAPAAVQHPSRPLHHNGQLVMGINNSLIAIDPATRHQHAILSVPVGDVVTSPAYSPDGTKLAYLRGRVSNSTSNIGGSPYAMDSIWVVDTTTGHAHQLTTCHRCSPYDYISWSPDGSRLAFSEADQHGSLQLHLINADGTHRTQVTHFPTGQNATQPAWSPDGSRIAFTFFTVANAPGHGIVFPTVNVDVIKPDGSGLVVLLDAAPAELGQDGSPYLEPAWSPDGSRIAYLVDPWPRGAGVAFQLWLMDPNGSHRTQIFQYPNCCVNAWGGPAWSPDGTRIAVVTAHTLWVMTAAGTALTSPGAISGDRPAWQPLP
jgi:Tol biopolymer transport system component